MPKFLRTRSTDIVLRKQCNNITLNSNRVRKCRKAYMSALAKISPNKAGQSMKFSKAMNSPKKLTPAKKPFVKANVTIAANIVRKFAYAIRRQRTKVLTRQGKNFLNRTRTRVMTRNVLKF